MKWGLFIKIVMLKPITILFIFGLILLLYFMKGLNLKEKVLSFFIGLGAYMLVGVPLSLPKNLVQKEILNGHVKNAKYEESWTERQKRTKQVPNGTKRVKVGNTWTTKTVYKTVVYYVNVRHPARYYFETSFGDIGISKNQFYMTSKDFRKNIIFEDLTRFNQVSSGDGNLYKYSFNKGELPHSTYHSYMNFITASDNTILKSTNKSILKNYKIPNYPTISRTKHGNHRIDRVIDFNNLIPDQDEKNIERYLDEWSSLNSYIKQCNLFVIVTSKDQNFYNAVKVKYQNGNKNDIILVVGMEDNKISWASSSCYSSDERFNSNVKNYVGRNFNLDFSKDLTKDVSNLYQRKPMDSFKYLVYNMPIKNIPLIFLLLIIYGSILVYNYKK